MRAITIERTTIEGDRRETVMWYEPDCSHKFVELRPYSEEMNLVACCDCRELLAVSPEFLQRMLREP